MSLRLIDGDAVTAARADAVRHDDGTISVLDVIDPDAHYGLLGATLLDIVGMHNAAVRVLAAITGATERHAPGGRTLVCLDSPWHAYTTAPGLLAYLRTLIETETL